MGQMWYNPAIVRAGFTLGLRQSARGIVLSLFRHRIACNESVEFRGTQTPPQFEAYSLALLQGGPPLGSFALPVSHSSFQKC